MNRAGRFVTMLVLATATARVAAADVPANLSGSFASMERQHDAALAEEYGFIDTPSEVRKYVDEGLLERVTGNADFALAGVSFPYARAEVRLFIERIGAQYRAALGEQLVVTSLTRPTALQPINAHALSVHPAGMAVDFRVPAGTKARVWLEKALLELEGEGVVDVTRERTPPHYHVAVYPAAYRAYLERVATPAVPVRVTSPAPQPAAAVTHVAVAASGMPAAGQSGSAPWMLLAPVVAGVALLGAPRVRRRPARVSIVR